MPHCYDNAQSPLADVHKIRGAMGSLHKLREHPAIVTFLLLALVLIGLVLLVSMGRALGLIQYLGLIAVSIATAAFAVVLMGEDGEPDS